MSIAEAIEKGDAERAETLTRGHLERAMELIFGSDADSEAAAGD